MELSGFLIFSMSNTIFSISTIHKEPELEPKLRNFSAPAPAKKAGSGSATLLLTVACVLDNKYPKASPKNKCSEERSTLDS